MAKKKFSSFALGLFVTGGCVILALVLVWIGATQYFERGRKYISYFNESVQGLQKDSEVKFRGVKVGRVEDITIAPDNRQVGVVMVINLKFDPTKDYVAQLELTAPAFQVKGKEIIRWPKRGFPVLHWDSLSPEGASFSP